MKTKEKNQELIMNLQEAFQTLNQPQSVEVFIQAGETGLSYLKENIGLLKPNFGEALARVLRAFPVEKTFSLWKYLVWSDAPDLVIETMEVLETHLSETELKDVLYKVITNTTCNEVLKKALGSLLATHPTDLDTLKLLCWLMNDYRFAFSQESLEALWSCMDLNYWEPTHLGERCLELVCDKELDDFIRSGALQLIHRAELQACVPALGQFLIADKDHPMESISSEIIQTLMDLKNPLAYHALEQYMDLPKNDDWLLFLVFYYDLISQALAATGSLEMLSHSLTNTDDSKRFIYFNAIGYKNNQEAIEFMLGYLLKHSSGGNGSSALSTLASMDNYPDISMFREFALHDNENFRLAAIDGLKVRDTESIRPFLLDRLYLDPCLSVKEKIITIFFDKGELSEAEREAIQWVFEQFRTELKRWLDIYHLEDQGWLFPVWKQALSDERLEVKILALKVIGKSNHPEKIVVLKQLLSHADETIRSLASSDLESLGCHPLNLSLEQAKWVDIQFPHPAKRLIQAPGNPLLIGSSSQYLMSWKESKSQILRQGYGSSSSVTFQQDYLIAMDIDGQYLCQWHLKTLEKEVLGYCLEPLEYLVAHPEGEQMYGLSYSGTLYSFNRTRRHFEVLGKIEVDWVNELIVTNDRALMIHGNHKRSFREDLLYRYQPGEKLECQKLTLKEGSLSKIHPYGDWLILNSDLIFSLQEQQIVYRFHCAVGQSLFSSCGSYLAYTCGSRYYLLNLETLQNRCLGYREDRHRSWMFSHDMNALYLLGYDGQVYQFKLEEE